MGGGGVLALEQVFALTILVTGLQNIDDVGEFKIRIGEQNEEVVNQIGRFILQLFLIVHRGGKCGFYAFFADFLRTRWCPRHKDGPYRFFR